MRTVFDLVGKFCRLSLDTKTNTVKQQNFTIVFQRGMSPTQCAVGKDVLRYLAIQYAQEHIVPGKCWFADWDLVERKENEENGGLSVQAA
jgi:hypothetical protein